MSNDELDMSWVNETTRITDMNTNYDPEPMEQITAHFIYINVNNYIEKTKTEHIPLDKSQVGDSNIRIITKDTLLKLIHQNQTRSNVSKYYLQDILWYNVELKPENIQKSIYSDNSEELFKQYFKIVQLIQIDDIILQPSVFIFHSLQCIYFIFKEKELELSNCTVKSILKTPRQSLPPIHIGCNLPKYSHTKKVQLDVKQCRKSKKRIDLKN